MACDLVVGELVAFVVRAVPQRRVRDPDVPDGRSAGHRAPPATGKRFFGDLLADLGGRGGHDVEVARVRRQVIPGALDLDERGDHGLAAGVHRRVVELRLVEQPVSGHIGLHLGDHLVDGLGDRITVGVLGDGAEDRVAHDHRRVGRVQDDDRLAALGAPDGLHTLAGGLGELVDVGPGPGPAETEETEATISAYGTSHHPRDRVDDRNGRLPPAGDHVDVRRVQVLAQVGRRDHRRAHRGRRQVDGADTRGRVLRRRGLVHVGAGRLEHQVGFLGLRQQPVNAFMSGLQTQLAGPRQALALRVDPHHPARFQPLGAQQLVEQVGADISRPDDGHTCLRRHAAPYKSIFFKVTETIRTTIGPNPGR